MRKVNLIPMAGAGQRFLDEGYDTPKPLIEVDGLPMVVKAARSLPLADCWIFICRAEHISKHQIDEKLREHFPNCKILSLDYLTEGQASTCLYARDFLKEDDQLTIGACDNGMEYDEVAFSHLIIKTDALIWTFRNNPSVMQNPKMYGWVDVDDSDKATRVSCKEPLSSTPLHDHAVIGAFSFRKAETFLKSVDTMILKNRKINNEFYLDVAMDECISLGYEVYPFEVNQYLCWGTPSDLKIHQNRH